MSKTPKATTKAKPKATAKPKARARPKAKARPETKVRPKAKARPETKARPKTNKPAAKAKAAAPVKKEAVKEAAAPAENTIEQDIEDRISLPPEPPQKLSGGGMGVFMVVVFLAVLGIGGYASWPYWSAAVAPYLPGGQAETKTQPAATPKVVDISSEQLAAERRQLRQSLDRLMVRMESIEKAVEAVKKLAQATTPPSEKIADGSALKGLTGRLNALEEDGAVMKTLLNRMDRMEETAAEQTVAKAKASAPVETAASHDAAAMVLAVENLRKVLATNDPFEKALDALKALAGDNPDINAAVVLLAKNASSGISTLPDLKQRFAGIAGKIVHASRATEKSGWLDRVRNRLSSLATWRRIDGKGEDAPIDAMVAKAESHLKAGDLKAAVMAVEGLSVNDKAAAVASPWLAAAKARLDADRAIASLHIHALSQLTLIKPAKG